MVNRWHAFPDPRLRNSGDTIERHQHAVAELCHSLAAFIRHPVHDSDLIQAALWHDEAERILGDMPRSAKRAYPEMARLYAQAERQILSEMGKLIDLPIFEEKILRLCDVAESWQWAYIHGVMLDDDKRECFRMAFKISSDAAAWWEGFVRKVEL
jgi:5'-deoxynucleotidase YfbR-like HD superfamily hydrolase